MTDHQPECYLCEEAIAVSLVTLHGRTIDVCEPCKADLDEATWVLQAVASADATGEP